MIDLAIMSVGDQLREAEAVSAEQGEVLDSIAAAVAKIPPGIRALDNGSSLSELLVACSKAGDA